MDDNWRQVLVAIASALGGLVTGIVIAKLGFDYSASQQREAWTREDEIRSAQAEQRDRERWLDRRRELYAAVIAWTFRVKLEDAPTSETITSAWAAVAEVELIRPDLGRLATLIVQAAVDDGLASTFSDRVEAFRKMATEDLARSVR